VTRRQDRDAIDLVQKVAREKREVPTAPPRAYDRANRYFVGS
jgi:hypothetical protein